MLLTLLTGAVMALSFSAPPGPVTMETLRRGLRGGFGSALQVQLGSIVGDVTWCLLALLGLAPLVQVPLIRWALGAAGVGVLVYLGASGIRDALRSRPALGGTETGAEAGADALAGAAQAGAFRSGVAISMANPMAVGYWLSVGGALVATGVAGTTAGQTAAFVAGFIGGTLAWVLLMALAVRWGRYLMTPGAFRWVTLACGAALLMFGATLAAQLAGQLL
jgi:threonine/homoserine/homoserine lactone efflux protein